MSNGCKCNCATFREHCLGVNFAPSATPSRRQGADVAAGNKAEKQIPRDHAAYRRLRAEGLQPKSVRGVAQVEAGASDVREITEGKIMSPTKLRERKLIAQAMKDEGMV